MDALASQCKKSADEVLAAKASEPQHKMKNIELLTFFLVFSNFSHFGLKLFWEFNSIFLFLNWQLASASFDHSTRYAKWPKFLAKKKVWWYLGKNLKLDKILELLINHVVATFWTWNKVKLHKIYYALSETHFLCVLVHFEIWRFFAF